MKLKLAIALLTLSGEKIKPSTAQFSSYINAFGGFGGGGSSPPECNDIITSDAKLEGDLSCDCTNGPALTIDGCETTFDMNGFGVSCQDSSPGSYDPQIGVGIKVNGKLNRILGPGNVTDTTSGIILDGEGMHTVTDVNVIGCGNDCITINSDRNIVEESLVKDANNDAVEIYQSTLNVVKNSKLDGHAFGIYINQGEQNTVAGNIIESSTINSIRIESGGSNTVSENNIRKPNPGEAGIDLLSSHDNVIRGNGISEFPDGIKILGSNHLHIERNHLFNSDDDYALNIENSLNTIISDNVIEHFGDYGIQMTSCSECSVVRNIIHDNDDYGIVDSYGTNNIYSDNVLTHHDQFGIYVDTCTGSVLTRNTAVGNGADDIDIYSSPDTVVAADNVYDTIYLPP